MNLAELLEGVAERQSPMQLGYLVPNFGRISLREANALLLGMHAMNMVQLQEGWPPISPALHSGRLRYLRHDRDWASIRKIWNKGGADCKSLAPAVSAEYQVLTGFRARPEVLFVHRGLAHVIVHVLERPHAGQKVDPSKTGGM